MKLGAHPRTRSGGHSGRSESRSTSRSPVGGKAHTRRRIIAGLIVFAVLALASRGSSNPSLTMGAVAIIIASMLSALLLWWAKDLFGIKSYREIFVPYK